MLFIIFILYFIILSIITYTLHTKNCKLSFFLLTIIAFLSICEFSIYIYNHFIQNKNVCQTTKELVC